MKCCLLQMALNLIYSFTHYGSLIQKITLAVHIALFNRHKTHITNYNSGDTQIQENKTFFTNLICSSQYICIYTLGSRRCLQIISLILEKMYAGEKNI